MNIKLNNKINKYINIIRKVENNFKLEHFTINEFNIWPLIRLELFKQFSDKKKSLYKKKIKKNYFKTFIIILDHLFNFIKYNKKIQSYNNQKINSIFFSDKKFYYEKYNSKYFNNLIDPYFYFNKSKKKIKIEFINSVGDKKKLFKPEYLNIYSLSIFNYIIFKFNFAFKVITNNKIKKKLENLEKKYLIKVNSNEILKNLLDIKYQSIVFEKIIKTIKPKSVYISCYYNIENLALSYTCNSLGVNCFDIQHGGIEDYHLMYANWKYKNIKKNNLLPNKFLVWDKRPISMTTLPNTKLKNFKIIGKQSINFWKKYENVSEDLKNKKNKNFLKKLKKYNVVLVCLTTEIPQEIPKLINELPNDNFWLIRAHPRHTNLTLIKKYLNQNIKTKNYDIDFSSKLNLNILLKNSDKFITDYSSTIYDADYFDLPKLVINNDLNFFKSWKKMKKFIFSNNLKEIKNFVLRKYK